MATTNVVHNPDGWVRLVYNNSTIALDRWPGEHHAGSGIHPSGGDCFAFDHVDPGAAEGVATATTRGWPGSFPRP